MILILKAFLRIFNSFEAIFRRENSTALQQKSQKRISRQAACLFTFYRRKYFFLPTADDQTFYVFVSKVQDEQGILSFRSPDVGLRIVSFRRPFRLLVWNFCHPGANRRQAPIRQQPWKERNPTILEVTL